MLQYIRGTLTEKTDTAITVEAGGLGYDISIAASSKLYGIGEGDEVLVYLQMIVREDDVSLYGFYEKKEKELFNYLLSVNGVGAKMAIAIFGTMSADEIRKAIILDDEDMLCRTKGLGKKTGQKIILELKDKLGSIDEDGVISGFEEVNIGSDERSQAISALVELGYTKSEAVKFVASVKGEDMTVEEYIKEALKKI